MRLEEERLIVMQEATISMMLLGMLGSKHLSPVLGGTSTGLMIALGLIILLEINAIMGKQGPMTTVKGVIHMSLLLTVAIWALLNYV